MPYQYKREPLNDDEVDKITNACNTFREKFVIWIFLDTGLRLSELAELKRKYTVAGKKTGCLWQRRSLRQKNQKKNNSHDR